MPEVKESVLTAVGCSKNSTLLKMYEINTVISSHHTLKGVVGSEWSLCILFLRMHLYDYDALRYLSTLLVSNESDTGIRLNHLTQVFKAIFSTRLGSLDRIGRSCEFDAINIVSIITVNFPCLEFRNRKLLKSDCGEKIKN